MPDHNWVLGHIIGDPFVVRSLEGGLVGGHAEAVADHPGQDLILPDGRQFKLLYPEVLFAM
jgi:hypothetical protein